MDLNEDSLSLLLKALRFASGKHNTQRRKDKKTSPYINHPIAVAETLWRVGQVREIATIISGILHDTIEDTDAEPDELQREFGSQIRRVVEEVSDDKNLSKSDRKRLQVENAHLKSLAARQIKLADKICNIQDIVTSPPSDWSVNRKMEYIIWSQDIVDRIRGTNSHLEKYFDDLCDKAKQLLLNK